jgi:hypothetical protein
MQLPDYFSHIALESQQAERTLARRRDLQMRKLRIAGTWGLAGLVVAFAVSFLVFAGQDSVPLFTGFPEWGTVGGFAPFSVPAQLGMSLERLAEAFNNFLQSGSSGQIAAVARLLTCLTIFVAVAFTYRRLLLEHYAAYGQPLQYADFKRSQQTAWRHVRRVMVALSAMICSYVLLTLVWLILPFMFKQLSAAPLAAAAYVALFVAAVTVAFVYWSLTVTTRDLMALGLLTFAAGLAGTFALAGRQQDEEWWQAAVSRAGADPNADWLFTATFGAVFLIFVVLWYDVKNFLRLIVVQSQAIRGITPFEQSSRPAARVGRWLRGHTYSLIRALYFTAIIGLLGVGFVQFDSRDITTVIAHTGGAVGAILIFNLGGLAYAYWFPDPILGQPFKRLSLACVLITLATIILWRLNIVNLAGLELLALVVVGIWFFFALDNLLIYIDSLSLQAQESPG